MTTTRANRGESAILALCGLAALALLLLGLALFDASSNAARSQGLVQHTEGMLRGISALRESLALAESGHRGFLLTGDAQFRDAREHALERMRREGAALEAQTSDNPLQRERMRRLAGLLEARVAIMRETEALRASRGGAAATRMFAGGLPEQAAAQARGLIDELAAEETMLLSERQQRDRDGQASMRRTQLVTSLAVLALVVPVLWVMVRQSRGRRHAESRLRAIAHSLPGTVFVLRRNREGRFSFEFLSMNAGELLGLDREMVLADAHSTRDSVLEEDRGQLNLALARSASDLSMLDVDFRIRRPDGSLRWVRSSARPTREDDGDVLWHGYWSDITGIKATEQALRDATRRLVDAQSVANIGDWTCDLATGEVSWSPQVYRMLQRDPAAGPPNLEEGVALFDGGAETTAEAFFRAQETGLPQPYELTARLPGGETATLEVIAVPATDAGGLVTGMYGTIQDVSSRKALEAHLSQAKEAAEAANRAKGEFLATMSHEIRTHLNGMLGILEVIFTTALEPDLRNALEGVRESGKSLQQIIDDILDYSKVEAGKLEIRPEPTSIEEVVAGVHRLHAGSASSLGLELRRRVDPAIGPAVMVDGLRLRQILGNFVSNAIKFTPSGHVEIRALLVAREGDRRHLRFQVEDTGIGIPPERQQRLFQPFEQADAHTATRFGGTGLGLSISRRLAELMGGEVGMTSALGKGTTMNLDLVVAVADPARLPAAAPKRTPVTVPRPVAEAKAPTAAQAARDGTLVLVVDDHPVNRMVMRSQLNTLGYAVEEVESGAEALEQWRTGRFALVLTDCNMPFMSGYELSRRIREVEASRGDRRTPIVACSANVIGSVREDCREAGMDDYIAKPTELVPLAEIMGRWLPLPRRRDGDAGDAGGTDPGTAADGELVLHPASSGDPAARKRVFAQFRRVNEADAAALAEAVERGDLAATTHLAHRIKGACGFIGATALAAACGRLEQAGRNGESGAIDGIMVGVRHELERLNAYIDQQPH